MRPLPKLLVFLLGLLLPTQLAIHFWPDWSFVSGRPVDYLSPTIFATDILIIFLVLPQFTILFRKYRQILITLVIFAFLNILFSISPVLTIYKWSCVIEYLFLILFLINNFYLFSPLRLGLILSLTWTGFLAVLQFDHQSSLGGLWVWLGERPLSLVQINIAKVDFLHELLLRPYATFPHPNALAGFMLVIYWLLKKPLLRLLIAAVLFLTFSRTAIIVFIFLNLVIYIKNKPKLFKIISVALFISLLIIILISLKNFPSLTERVSLSNIAVHNISLHPLLGTGLGTFIPSLESNALVHQPVHNTYLLLASELGLSLVVLLTIVALKYLLQIKNRELKIALLSISLTGLFDHYWLTSHQNILLLTILLALSITKLQNNQMNGEIDK